ncbi:GATOR complex protein WDR24 isoform X2 [Pieris brassicae]|uniref:GATOR complex protein WDR24 isoform X2 n=1 Tax=Pieris brassicae TaxID=7116 RepID=UPI001E6624A9|nr:GATOR complex protein WDR24 isoform X2 [Pieris brassicae]
MIPSNTICVSQEGPANALALNKDCTQVVIAGRNVFKVFSIGEDEFSEVCNLRVGKNLNLNFSSIDVAWSTLEENTLATAATNGAVVVWNLGRSGRSKQEHVFSDHKRTVNKVSFHLTEPSLLISGSQDGMMKCFDLRMKEVARTFISNTESIRDVQFSPHTAHVLAAVSENGTVQLWDARRHERPLHQFTAHSGPVFACDWHPDVPWLATASRDKTIKVWDIHAKPNLEHTIHTIASVGHVKWRPQKKYQVASCALVLDCAVHVWDVRRPHVPLATFAEHRDVTTAIAWVASPDVFLSTSRDCSLYRHRFSEAAHPVLWANPQGVAVSARGQVAHAAPDRPLPAGLAAPQAPPPPHAPFPRKQPTAGSLGAGAQAALEVAFAGGAASTLRRHDVRPLDDAVIGAARRYRFHGDPPHVLAKHNARVARHYGRFMTAHVWEVMGAVYSARSSSGPPPAPPPPRDPPPRPDPAPPTPSHDGVEEEREEETEEWESRSHKHSGVLGLPTHTIYVPPHRARSQSGESLSASPTPPRGSAFVTSPRFLRGRLGVCGVAALRGHRGGRVDAAGGGLRAASSPAARRARPRSSRGGQLERTVGGGGSARLSGRLHGLRLAPARARLARPTPAGSGAPLRRGGRVRRRDRRRRRGTRSRRPGAPARERAAPARRAGRRADGGHRAARAAGAPRGATGVRRRAHAGAVAAGLHGAAAATQGVGGGRAGGARRVARRRMGAVAAVDQRGGVLRALRPANARRRLRPLRGARAGRAVRRVPPARARPVRLVPGLLARRPPAPHAPLAARTRPVPGRLRAPLPARLTRRRWEIKLIYRDR